MKACVGEGRFDRALGHELLPDALDLVLSLDPTAWRQVGRLGSALPGWHSNVRYRATGETASSIVIEGVARASSQVDAIVAGLWADGQLTEVPT